MSEKTGSAEKLLKIAVFNRFYHVESMAFKTMQEATQFLQAGSDNCSLSPVGLYDAATKTAYIPQLKIIGRDPASIHEELLDTLRDEVEVGELADVRTLELK